MTQKTIDHRSLCTLLAALRFYQSADRSNIDFHITSIASEDDTITPLSDDEIDALCEDLNTLPLSIARSDPRLAALEKLVARIKYYGDGYRWFNRRGHKCPNAIVAAFEDFEAEFGLVQETSDEDMKDLYARRPCE